MMRFRIAHLMWLIAACAVYFGLVRWHGKLLPGADPMDKWFMAPIVMTIFVVYGLLFFHSLAAAWKRSNRRASEEFVERYTSGRDVRIEDRWNT